GRTATVLSSTILRRSFSLLEMSFSRCRPLPAVRGPGAASCAGTSRESGEGAEASGGAERPGLFEALALVRIEIELAQPDRLRRHLDQFVVLYPGERALQRHADRRGELDRLVLAGGADVGQLLALQHIDLEIVVAGMDADDHAGIDLDARIDDHRAAILEVP